LRNGHRKLRRQGEGHGLLSSGGIEPRELSGNRRSGEKIKDVVANFEQRKSLQGKKQKTKDFLSAPARTKDFTGSKEAVGNLSSAVLENLGKVGVGRESNSIMSGGAN